MDHKNDIEASFALSQELLDLLEGHTMLSGSAALASAMGALILMAERQVPGTGAALIASYRDSLMHVEKELASPGYLENAAGAISPKTPETLQ
jgi:Asp/Glu/hydantoin racemase